MKEFQHLGQPQRLSALAGFVVAALCVSCAGPTASRQGSASVMVPAGDTPAAPLAPEQALARLLQGNQRYVADRVLRPDQSSERRRELANGQAPFAIILTCSDSRVAPELFFDQGLGDLFVVRNAGNILDDHVLGSMEYAVEHLHVGLIVVVGHSQCGAVAAAVAGGEVPGHIRSVTQAIAPAAEQARNLPGDKVDNAVRVNAEQVAQSLAQQDPILKAESQAGHLKVVAARYDLSTGQVEILK